MNSKLRATRGVAAVLATATGALITCGSAAANPVDELVEIIARVAEKAGKVPGKIPGKVAGKVPDLHVPAPPRIDPDIIYIDPRALGEILGPSLRASRGNRDEFINIKNGACEALGVGTVSRGSLILLFPGYTEGERDAIGQQAQNYLNLSPILVEAICNTNS